MFDCDISMNHPSRPSCRNSHRFLCFLYTYTPDFKDLFVTSSGLDCPMSGDGRPVLPDNVTAICADATCEFYRYGNPDTYNWLQVRLGHWGVYYMDKCINLSSFQLYNLFGLLWGLFFLSALEEMVMAGAFAAWYFTKDKSQLHRAPLMLSARRLEMTYYMHRNVHYIEKFWCTCSLLRKKYRTLLSLGWLVTLPFTLYVNC